MRFHLRLKHAQFRFRQRLVAQERIAFRLLKFAARRPKLEQQPESDHAQNAEQKSERQRRAVFLQKEQWAPGNNKSADH